MRSSVKIASGAQLALFNENRERRSTRAREKTSGARERRSLSAARSCSGTYRILSKYAGDYFLFLNFRSENFCKKMHKSCLKIEKFIENQIFKLCVNGNSAIAIPFYQKCAYNCFRVGLIFELGLFLRGHIFERKR